jgi:hypothetical protein
VIEANSLPGLKEIAWEPKIEVRVLLSPSIGDKSPVLDKGHIWMALLQLGDEVSCKRAKFVGGDPRRHRDRISKTNRRSFFGRVQSNEATKLNDRESKSIHLDFVSGDDPIGM